MRGTTNRESRGIILLCSSHTQQCSKEEEEVRLDFCPTQEEEEAATQRYATRAAAKRAAHLPNWSTT